MSIRQGTNTIAGAVGKYPLNERNISNCITEIPQDIKLELNNGVLTLKAGSKVYVPNGFEEDEVTPHFDIYTIESDISYEDTITDAQTVMIFFQPNNPTILFERMVKDTYSGSTKPTGTYKVWYDTVNNIINGWGSNTEKYVQKSFPICVASTGLKTFISIDQVFNGFGYIGSTVFALPGVKGLIPDGRNADGSLKNVEVTVNNVLTSTGPYNNQLQWVILYGDSISSWDSKYWIGYNSQENILFNKEGSSSATSGSKIMACVCAFLSVDENQKIKSFTSKKAFHAVDYNDTEYIAHQAMPSNRYIDLTLGASGASYTAPADGYVFFCKVAQEFPREILIANDAGMTSQMISAANGNWLRIWLPVRKGSVFKVTYDVTGATKFFTFVYAEGAQ